MSKEEKQRQFLNEYADKTQDTFERGIRTLKASRIETKECEDILNECLKVFTSESIPTKVQLTKAVQDLDGVQGYMMHEWIEHFDCDVDPTYLDKISEWEEKRARLYSKALEHMEKKGCAGFDDVKSYK